MPIFKANLRVAFAVIRVEPGMSIAIPDTWLRPPDLRTGSDVQRAIAARAERADRIGPVDLIAGVDTSMAWRDTRGPIHAAIAPLSWPEGQPQAAISLTTVPAFPYVSGYLGFREVPPLVTLLQEMVRPPDLLIVDGQGIAHPRRCGFATHLGVLADLPTIGCAKTRLCGTIDGEVGDRAGDHAPLIDRGEQVGVALRTRAGANPVFVSVGHRVALPTAIEWIMRLSGGRRLPLPIRLAHDAANASRRRASTPHS